MDYAHLFFILVGLIFGLASIKWVMNKGLGCIVLLLAPISSLILVATMGNVHPERQTSTSGLDYLYAGFYSSAVAIMTCLAIKLRNL